MSPTPTATGLSRRRYLAATLTTATVAVAGCSNVIDWVADQVLEDVNLFNETNSNVSGTIQVVDGSETAVLDDEFTLSPPDEDDSGTEEDDQNLNTYADIWTGNGSYEITLELDDPIDGETGTTETVTIEAADDEMVMIGLGIDDEDEPIVFRVGDSVTDAFDE